MLYLMKKQPREVHMYYDAVLFTICGAFAVLALILAAYRLWVFNKVW